MLKRIPSSSLAEVLSSLVLTVEGENELLETVTKICKESGSEYRRLLGQIHFEYLDERGMKEFLDFVDFEDLDIFLWT